MGNGKQQGVVIYRESVEALLSLQSLEDVKTILGAMLSLGIEGEEPEIPDRLKFGWIMIAKQIRTNTEHYKAVSSARSEARKRKLEQIATKTTNVTNETIVTIDPNPNPNTNTNTNTKPTPDGVCVLPPAPAPAREKPSSPKIGKYPETIEEVLSIASGPRCGVVMSKDQAQKYLLARMNVDWVDGKGRTIRPANVPGDIKLWMINEPEWSRRNGRASPVPLSPPKNLTDEEYMAP